MQLDETETDEKCGMENTRLEENSNEIREELPCEIEGIPEGGMYGNKLIERMKDIAERLLPSTKTYNCKIYP